MFLIICIVIIIVANAANIILDVRRWLRNRRGFKPTAPANLVLSQPTNVPVPRFKCPYVLRVTLAGPCFDYRQCALSQGHGGDCVPGAPVR